MNRAPLSDTAKLIPDVRLIAGDVSATNIEVSSGLATAAVLYPDLPYHEPAFVPLPPWRSPTDEELALLHFSPDMSLAPGAWLKIFSIPPPILEPFEQVRRASASMTNRHELRARVRHPDCQEALKRLLCYAMAFTAAGDYDPASVDVFGNPPNLPTTTMLPSERFNGLHIDNWYPRPPVERGHSPNRLSINLGLCDRFFLYVNLSAARISRLLKMRGLQYAQNELSTLGLRTCFMRGFARYPVIKLRLMPGHGLIAPTENIIHDGCTIGHQAFDIRFSVRGQFSPFELRPKTFRKAATAHTTAAVVNNLQSSAMITPVP